MCNVTYGLAVRAQLCAPVREAMASCRCLSSLSMERTALYEKEHGPCSGVQGQLPRVHTLESARDSDTHDRGEFELRELVARQEVLLGDHGLWSPQARGGQRQPPHCATQPPQPTNDTQSLANASSCPYIELADDACTGQHGEGTWPVETGSKVMVGCRDPIGPAVSESAECVTACAWPLQRYARACEHECT